MKILFISSEVAPFSKSGGLADVAFSLPPALQNAGQEVNIVTPLYSCVMNRFKEQIEYVKNMTITLGWRRIYCGLFRGELNGVTVWFIDNQEFFYRDRLYGYDDDALRFAFFSKASIDLMSEFDFMPQIIHCNDWESAMAIIYLKDKQTLHPELRRIKSVFTIHNIAYQGQYGANLLQDTLGLDDGWYQGGLGFEYKGRHDINMMQGAMLMADAVNTVSPTYAREIHQAEYGMGLQGVVNMVNRKLYGILNGIDVDHYDPDTDPTIPARFSYDSMHGKATCKEYIQQKFDLAIEPQWPLLAMVARLNEQKGYDLIRQVLPDMMDLGIQLIVYGQGEQRYVDYFRWAKSQWPDQIGFSDDFNEQTASEVFAGADMYLMPSKFEPCGLSQMMAMRYGTVPIVHETGGLKDSIRAYSDFDNYGDGFSFVGYEGQNMYMAIQQAVKIYFGDRRTWSDIRMRCMRKDLSWDKSANRYIRMYTEISDVRGEHTIPFEKAFERLKKAYKKVHTTNMKKYKDQIPANFHRVMQIRFDGRSEGVFYVEVEDTRLHAEPYTYDNADVYIECTYDNLLDMAAGKISADTLFLNGQLRILGNVAKGYELRKYLTPQ